MLANPGGTGLTLGSRSPSHGEHFEETIADEVRIRPLRAYTLWINDHRLWPGYMDVVC